MARTWMAGENNLHNSLAYFRQGKRLDVNCPLAPASVFAKTTPKSRTLVDHL